MYNVYVQLYIYICDTLKNTSLLHSTSEKLEKQQALHGRCECVGKVLEDFLERNFLRGSLLFPSAL